MAVSLHVFGHLVFVGNKFMSSYPSLTSISYNYIIYTQLYTCIFIIFVDFAGPCCMFHILFPRQKLDHTPGQAKGPKGQRANASRVSRVSNCDGRGAVVGFAPRGLHWKMCQRPLAALLLYSLQGMGFF